MNVGLPEVHDLVDGVNGETSSQVARRVYNVREHSAQRNADTASTHEARPSLNASIAVDDLDRVAPLHPAARAVLRRELEVGRLSGRGLHRVRRVARTIADLDGMPDVVGEQHVATALAMRTGLAVLTGVAR